MKRAGRIAVIKAAQEAARNGYHDLAIELFAVLGISYCDPRTYIPYSN